MQPAHRSPLLLQIDVLLYQPAGCCSLINTACTGAHCLHLQCHTQWLVVSLMLQTNTPTYLTICVYVCVLSRVFFLLRVCCVFCYCVCSKLNATVTGAHQLAGHTSTLVCVCVSCYCVCECAYVVCFVIVCV